MTNKSELKSITSKSVGVKIDTLIVANLTNWHSKEILNKKRQKHKDVVIKIAKAFQANKKRNRMITEINQIVHKGPKFHFRNYHNY